MPIYEYKCQSCSHEFEKLVFRGEEDYVACPECSHTEVKHLISSSSIRSESGLGACMPGNPGKFS